MNIFSFRFSFFVVALLFAAVLHAQESIVAAGGNARIGNISISWSIGEVMTEAYAKPPFTLTQGVQQPSVKVETVSSSPEMNAYEISAYPNPTSDAVTVSIAGKTEQLTLTLKIFDMNGRLLQVMPVKDGEIRISLSNFAAGAYILQISDRKNNVQTFKIIKN